MTAESDQHVVPAVGAPAAGARPGDSKGGAGSASTRGLSAKLLPPTDPVGTFARPALEARIHDGTARRLTIVVAGAGFGKSTLAAQIASSRPTAWYTLDPSDRHVGALAAGIVAALRVRVPNLPADLSAPVETSIEATDEAAMMAQANAAAALITDALQTALEGDLVLVLDDLHALDRGNRRLALRRGPRPARAAGPPPARHVADRGAVRDRAIARPGPGRRSRRDDPGLHRRPRSKRCSHRSSVDAIDAADRSVAAARIHDATGGWPAAVRLAIEAYRTALRGRPRRSSRPAPAAGGPDLRVPRGGGRRRRQRRDTIARAARGPLRSVLGAAPGGRRCRGPGADPRGAGPAGAVSPATPRRTGLVRAPRAHPRVHRSPACRFPRRRSAACTMRLPAGSRRTAGSNRRSPRTWPPGDPSRARPIPRRSMAGRSSWAAPRRQVVEASASLPMELRDEHIERACGEACLARGEWREAKAAFSRAAGRRGRSTRPPRGGWAWSTVFVARTTRRSRSTSRRTIDGSQPADEALLNAWIASAHAHRGDIGASRAAAERAVAQAQAATTPERSPQPTRRWA